MIGLMVYDKDQLADRDLTEQSIRADYKRRGIRHTPLTTATAWETMVAKWGIHTHQHTPRAAERAPEFPLTAADQCSKGTGR